MRELRGSNEFINGGDALVWAPDFQTLIADLDPWCRRGYRFKGMREAVSGGVPYHYAVLASPLNPDCDE